MRGANSDLSRRRGNREQGTGNRNGGCRVDYENVHAAGATPFSNECSGGIYVAATGFSGMPRLIVSRELMLWLGCTAPCAAFPVPCSLLTVPFELPLAIPPTPRYIRIYMRLNSYSSILPLGVPIVPHHLKELMGTGIAAANIALVGRE